MSAPKLVWNEGFADGAVLRSVDGCRLLRLDVGSGAFVDCISLMAPTLQVRFPAHAWNAGVTKRAMIHHAPPLQGVEMPTATKMRLVHFSGEGYHSTVTADVNIMLEVTSSICACPCREKMWAYLHHLILWKGRSTLRLVVDSRGEHCQ